MSVTENYDPSSVMLTDTQKGVLAVIANSPTPEMAYETINGTPALVTARNLLEQLGLIRVGGNKAVLTQTGQQAVVANNIADETGQLTDEGAALIDKVNAGKSDYKVVEGFSLLKTLI